jgi:hypothetical protein
VYGFNHVCPTVAEYMWNSIAVFFDITALTHFICVEIESRGGSE